MTNDAIRCTQLTRHYGDHTVLSGVDWAIARGCRAGLVGESGAGKTTLLRIISGLEQADTGQVQLDPPTSRVGMVFQNLSLWPHLTARQHVQCVQRGLPPADSRPSADELLEELQLSPRAWQLRPSQLSGGQRQRVALARALAYEPHILLMDEPLTQLDLPLRQDILSLMEQVMERRQTTLIYVSHSWPEVLQLCDRIAVLADGRILQEGSMMDVFRHPSSHVAARLTGPVTAIDRELVDERRISVIDGARPAHMELSDSMSAQDESLPLHVRPHHVYGKPPDATNRWQVVDCRPGLWGWQVTLYDPRDARQLRVLSSNSWHVDSWVGVEIRGDATR